MIKVTFGFAFCLGVHCPPLPHSSGFPLVPPRRCPAWSGIGSRVLRAGFAIHFPCPHQCSVTLNLTAWPCLSLVDDCENQRPWVVLYLGEGWL